MSNASSTPVPHLTDIHQDREAREKQSYLRKRCLQVIPKPAADSNKRQKANDFIIPSRLLKESNEDCETGRKQQKQIRSEVKQGEMSEVQNFPNSWPGLSSASSDDNAMEALETEKQVHIRKRGLQEAPEPTSKRQKATGCFTLSGLLKGSNEDCKTRTKRRPLTQIFVHCGGTCMSMQVNLETTTVRELIHFALSRKAIRFSDVFLLHCGKVLGEAYTLSVLAIPRNASFCLIPRLRAGCPIQIPISSILFVEAVKGLKPFYRVNIPQILQKKNSTGNVFVVFLSQSVRAIVHQILLCISKLHSEDLSLNGKFKITDFMFWNGCAMLHPNVKTVHSAPNFCIRDLNALGQEIKTLFTRTGLFPIGFGDLPGYVNHLVNALMNFKTQYLVSKAYRPFLHNHPCLQSFKERIRKCMELEMFYVFLDPVHKANFESEVGNFPGWEQNITSVEPINDTYMYNYVTPLISRFSSKAVDWIALVRYFFNHPNQKNRGPSRRVKVKVGFTEEQAEAAVDIGMITYLLFCMK